MIFGMSLHISIINRDSHIDAELVCQEAFITFDSS